MDNEFKEYAYETMTKLKEKIFELEKKIPKLEKTLEKYITDL